MYIKIKRRHFIFYISIESAIKISSSKYTDCNRLAKTPTAITYEITFYDSHCWTKQSPFIRCAISWIKFSVMSARAAFCIQSAKCESFLAVSTNRAFAISSVPPVRSVASASFVCLCAANMLTAMRIVQTHGNENKPNSNRVVKTHHDAVGSVFDARWVHL